MAFLDIKNVAVKGISACVPKNSESVKSMYKWDGVEAFMETTGVRARRIADPDVTTSDLCYPAAVKLIDELGWDRNDIGVLIFVTQTPDYMLPATACILQNRLGLTKDCYALDISLGCSGWVYGLSVIAALMQNGTIRKGLLLAGETTSKTSHPEDKSARPLFGDAGTAVALEYDENSRGMQFVMNTDGSGAETIIIRDGGYRNQTTADSLVVREYDEGIARDRMSVELDGLNVFSFGISKAPKSVKSLVEHFGIDKEDVDLVTFHQANKMMNEMIRKKLNLTEQQVPYSLADFGNTSSASIPLTLVSEERELLQNKTVKHIACGFGVGLSWGSVYFETDKIVVPELIEL